MVNSKNKILVVIGIFLILFGLFAMFYSFSKLRPSSIFWVCYIGMILIGIGMLRKDSLLIASQLNVLTVLLLVWIADFVYFVFTKDILFGVATYFFFEPSLAARTISLGHFFLLPLGFYALYLIKLKRKDTWKISFAYVTIVYLITKFLSSGEYNANCVFNSCLSLISDKSLYSVKWFVIAFSIILLTNFIINKIFYR